MSELPATIDAYFDKPDAKPILTIEVMRNTPDRPKYYMSDSPYETEIGDEPSFLNFAPVISGMPELTRSISDPFDGAAETTFGSVTIADAALIWFFDNGLLDMDGEGTLLALEQSTLALTRASAAAVISDLGVLTSVANDVPRFQTDPITLAPLGILIEDTRTNIWGVTEDLTAVSWTKSNATITANASVAPDGAITMDALVEDATATIGHFVSRNASFVLGNIYAISAYGKELPGSAKRYLNLFAGSGAFGVNQGVLFDLANGTVKASFGGASGYVEQSPNGSWRCTMITIAATITASAGASARLNVNGTSNAQTYSGDGSSGVLLWGTQIEIGTNSTSYIAKPTTVDVTRAIDDALMPVNTIAAGYMDFDAYAPIFSDDQGNGIRLDDGTGSNRIQIRRNNTTGKCEAIIIAGGVNQATLTSAGTWTPGTRLKGRVSWATNSFSLSFNGEAPIVDGAGTVPVFTQLHLRSWGATVCQVKIGDTTREMYNWDFVNEELVSEQVLDLGHGSGVETFRAKRGAMIVGKMAAPRGLYPYRVARTLFHGQLGLVGHNGIGERTLEITDVSEDIKKSVIPVGSDPLAFGFVRGMTARLKNPLTLGYSVHDGRINAIRAVYDQGAKLAENLYTVNLAASPQIILAGTPQGTVTADVEGHVDEDGVWLTSTPQIVGELLRRCGFDLTQNYNFVDEGTIGIPFDQSENLGDIITDLMRGCAAYWLVDQTTGDFYADAFPVPADGGTVYDEQFQMKEVDSGDVDRITDTVRYLFRRNWTKLQPLAGATQADADFAQSEGTELSVTLDTPDDEIVYQQIQRVETYFENAGSAENAARRILALYGVQRKHISAELPYNEARKLGDGITLYFDGAGYNSVILSITDVFDGGLPVQRIEAIA